MRIFKHSFCCKMNKTEGPFGDIENFSKSLKAENVRKKSQSRKWGESQCQKSIKGDPSALECCKKISAYAPVRTRTSGLKSKHLTTRPRTPELCELPAETRVRGIARKKHPHFPITLIASLTQRRSGASQHMTKHRLFQYAYIYYFNRMRIYSTVQLCSITSLWHSGQHLCRAIGRLQVRISLGFWLLSKRRSL